ncbi:pyruvate dehydrogenase (acetyl-transferring) E1 component subunit alpha [Maricurvus nonylphenolicus]|uniref:thiamine pyrophosphate-dependent dehydrogenase E1 component subunit alpha n=1 Tax=Maricurvus nonylphenolicus TaxID=1008307 RepID=UPI0036F2C773
MSISSDQKKWMYETMSLIRFYEDQIGMIYFEGKLPPKVQKGLAFDLGAGPIPGEMHLSAGQEAAAVGSCIHLQQGDSVWGTHRAHHFAIAHGVDLKAMTAEMFGKVDGLCRGKGGHMHLFDPKAKFACTGIVGAGIPQAVGAGLAYKKAGSGAVALAEFGEGAANEGAFHEALNMAGLWNLPCVFVCQDNNYGISTNKATSTAVESNADRASSYGIPGIKVDQNHPERVFEAVAEAVARAREGLGSTLIEVKVDRYYGHFQGDPEIYRPKGEVEKLQRDDPIPAYAKQLVEEGVYTDAEIKDVQKRVEARVIEAIEYARASEYPDICEAWQHAFV